MKPVRKARVSAFLRTEIARIIQHDLSDPRIGFVTVIDVEPTEDFKEAKVSVSILGDAAAQRTSIRGLEAARGFIQAQLAKVSHFRETPMLQFILDDSIRKQMEIEDRIREVRRQDGAVASDTSASEGPSDETEETGPASFPPE